MQIGDELDGQVALLDEVDGHVDRHYTRMEGAKRRLGKFRKKAGENWGLTTIVILIVILVFLIIILK
jgi:syntaxin 8